MGKSKEKLESRVSNLKVENKDLKIEKKALKEKIEKLLNKNSDLKDIIKLESNHDKVKSEKLSLTKKNKLLRKQIEDLEKQIDLILWIKWKPFKTKTFNIKTKTSSWANAVLVASDWHIEERVDPTVVNWINEYSVDIAEKRSEKFFKNSLILLEEFKNLWLEKRNWNKRELVLALLWDFISWYIHDELEESNELSPTQSIIKLKWMIKSWINLFLENWYPLIVPCNFWNHWRTTTKKRISTWYKNNYEWMMYQMLRDEYKDDKNIKFLISNWYFNYLNLEWKTLRFHHWDQINYWWWVWWPTIPINKAIDRFNKSKYANYDVFWHFHQTLNHKNFVVNWSLIGPTPYWMKFWYEEPSQTLFLLDKKHWKTIHTPIYVK